MLRRTKHKVRRRRAAVALLAPLARGRVLDAPCGDGALARDLAARIGRVCGADLAPLPIGADISFVRLDLDRPLPFPDATFDAVVSLEGIEHLLAPARCLAEFCRVLRPRGRLVLTTPNVNNVQSRWHYLVSGRFSGFRPLARQELGAAEGGVIEHASLPYLPTLVYVLGRHGVTVERIDVTMVRTRQWLALPLAAPLWLASRRAPARSLARTLGSFALLLGRNVIVQGEKRA